MTAGKLVGIVVILLLISLCTYLIVYAVVTCNKRTLDALALHNDECTVRLNTLQAELKTHDKNVGWWRRD